MKKLRTAHTTERKEIIEYTFSSRARNRSFSCFLKSTMNSLNSASRSFIFSIALNRGSFEFFAAKSLNDVLNQSTQFEIIPQKDL